MLSDYEKSLLKFKKIPPSEIQAIPAERCSDPKQVTGSTWFRQDEVTKRASLAERWTYREDLAVIDPAKSAFHEENFGPTAQLSRFLEEAKAGNFKHCQVVMLWAHENRFTRAKIGNAKAKLKEFTDNGIAVYFVSSGLLLLSGWEHEANIDNRLTWAFDAARKDVETRQEYAIYSHKKKREDLAAGAIVNTGQYPRWLMFVGTSNKLPGKYVESTELVFPNSNKLMTYWDIAVRIKTEALSNKSFHQIIVGLNVDKIPCFGRSRRWRPSNFNRFLKSKCLLGIGTFTMIDNSGDVEVKTVKEFKIYPAVATEEEWNAIQHRIAKNNRHPGVNAMSGGVNSLFPQIVSCAECGEILHTQAKEKGNYGNPFNRRYRCRHYQLGGGCSAKGSLATAPLEEDFFGVFLQQFPEVLAQNQNQETDKSLHAHEAQVSLLKTEVEDLSAALKVAKNVTAKTVVMKLLNEAGANLEKAEQELKAAAGHSLSAAQSPKTLNALQAAIRNLDYDPTNPQAWRDVELTNEILKQQLSDPEIRRLATELIPDLIGGLVVDLKRARYAIKNVKGDVVATRDLSVVIAALRQDARAKAAKLIRQRRKKRGTAAGFKMPKRFKKRGSKS